MKSLYRIALACMCTAAVAYGGPANSPSDDATTPKSAGPSAAPQPQQSPQRSSNVNPSPSAWASRQNDTVYRNPSTPTQTPGSGQKFTPVNPSPSAWAFGHNDTVYKHPAPTYPTPHPRPPHHHGPSCGHRPGHWEWCNQSVWIPGYWTQQYYPARYEYRMVNGLAISTLVQSEHYENVWIPGYYVSQPTRVWVPATWNCRY